MHARTHAYMHASDHDAPPPGLSVTAAISPPLCMPAAIHVTAAIRDSSDGAGGVRVDQGHEAFLGAIDHMRKGVLVCMAPGKTTEYALNDLEARGVLFVDARTEVCIAFACVCLVSVSVCVPVYMCVCVCVHAHTRTHTCIHVDLNT